MECPVPIAASVSLVYLTVVIPVALQTLLLILLASSSIKPDVLNYLVWSVLKNEFQSILAM